MLAEGWPQDLRTCLQALVEHAPPEVAILVLDLGNVDGAGDVAHEVATAAPGRVQEWHLERACGWAEARTALLRADTATVHIWLDPSSVLTGDAISPVLAAFDDPTVVGAGWRGVSADPDWLGFTDAAPGEVDALLGYLFGMRRSAALVLGGPHPKARFYRNADMEFSFALREAGRATGSDRLVMTGPLPVTQGRHHGYHDTAVAYRDKESKRTYDRFLQRFRGREDLRVRRAEQA
ncbi:MAG: glycosyltransferase [Actinomycetota bacterium]|nr:glycosyltransferase [Actinomycetota bacterium]